MLKDISVEGSLEKHSFRLIEVNKQGEVLDHSVPFQFDSEDADTSLEESKGTLVFNLEGTTPKNGARHYHLYLGFDKDGEPVFSVPSFEHQVAVSDNIYHRGQYNYKIITKNPVGKSRPTYYYHKQGAGFASMYDADGNDWINYSIAEGDKGEWRGIPNIGWDGLDEDPGFGHPGYTTGQSEIVNKGPVKTTIRSWSNNGEWELYWEIYSSFARLTVTKVPPERNYWFLYEGTPGGDFNDSDYFVRDDGTFSSISESWAGDLEWGYFTSKEANRSLFLVHLDHDDKEDSYYKLRTMTVFGFGRGSGDNHLDNLLTETPSRFIVGLADGTDFSWISKVVESSKNTLSYNVGSPETYNSAK